VFVCLVLCWMTFVSGANEQFPLTIYSYPKNPRVYKTLITSKFNGVDVLENVIDMQSKAHKAPDFRRNNPFGKVPSLFLSETSGAFESNSIMRYIARLDNKNSLYSTNKLGESRVDAFLDVGISLERALGDWIYGKTNEVQEQGKKDTKTILAGYEYHFQINKKEIVPSYLVGDTITIADIGNSMSMFPGFTKLFDKEFLLEFPYVEKWFFGLMELPQFSQVIGTVEWARDRVAQKDGL